MSPRDREHALTGVGAALFVGVALLVMGAPGVVVVSLLLIGAPLAAWLMVHLNRPQLADVGLDILTDPPTPLCPDWCHHGERRCDWSQHAVNATFDAVAQGQYDTDFTDLVTNVWIISAWTVKS